MEDPSASPDDRDAHARWSLTGRLFSGTGLAWQELMEYHPLPECACGGCVCDVAKRALEAREKEKLFGFLMGLDRKLGKGMARIMLMKPRPSFNEAYSLLVNWTTS